MNKLDIIKQISEREYIIFSIFKCQDSMDIMDEQESQIYKQISFENFIDNTTFEDVYLLKISINLLNAIYKNQIKLFYEDKDELICAMEDFVKNNNNEFSLSFENTTFTIKINKNILNICFKNDSMNSENHYQLNNF